MVSLVTKPNPRRSESARKRRRAKQRARQYQGVQEHRTVSQQLALLEEWAERSRKEWILSDTVGLTDGTARPGLCPWAISEGPPTRSQSEVRDCLEKAVGEFEQTDAGKFVARWISLPREEQAGFDWSAVEKDFQHAADKMRKEWCLLLKCDPRRAHSGSPLRPELLRALSETFLEGVKEDKEIIDEVDFGVNIGARKQITASGIWVPYSASDIPGHPVSLFEREAFRNYKSARDAQDVVVRELESSVRKGHMVKLAKGEEPPTSAVVSKIALIEKPNRNPPAFRLINDMRRSGLNSLITSQGNVLETVSLPGLRSVGVLLQRSLEAYGGSARLIELDARDAFRHLRVAPEDEQFLFVAVEPQVDEGQKVGADFEFYYHVRLPFGLVTSPLIWVRAYSLCHRLIRAICQLLCVLYVDDGSWGTSAERCYKDFVAIILVSLALGVSLELSKARVSNTPKTLGFRWDLETGTVSIPDEKLDMIESQGKCILQRAYSHKGVEIRLLRVSWVV